MIAIWSKYCHISTLDFFRMQNFIKNDKTLRFIANCLISIFLNWNLKKLASIFQASKYTLFQMRNFVDEKALNLEAKFNYLGIFGL